MADTVHRQGPLKQTNKTHKTGKHRSKGAVNALNKGKVNLKEFHRKNKLNPKREQRRNHMEQLRKKHRQENFDIKRKLGSGSAPPFLVCILPMHSQIDPKSALAILESCDEEAVIDRSAGSVTYITLPRFKQKFSFVIPPVGRGNEIAVLDYLKVCDTTLLLTSAAFGEDEVFDKWGHRIFNMLNAQGIPSPIVALMDLESINPKRRIATKAAVQKFISKRFPEEKIMQLDTNTEGLNLMRRIGTQKQIVLPNVANRPHLFGDQFEFIQETSDANDGTLQVTGFLRGPDLNINGIVHVPGLGDFQLKAVEILPNKSPTDKIEDMQLTFGTRRLEDGRLVCVPDQSKQTPLLSEHVPDPDDLDMEFPEEDDEENSKSKRKPSEKYKNQAAWVGDDEPMEDDGEYTDAEDEEDDEFLSCESENDGEISDTESEVAKNDEKYDLEMDLQEERETMKKIKEANMDEMWPDEIDTPLDVLARERFQKYRGLESFKTSPWDPKENLPADYCRIYQFENFNRTKRRVLEENSGEFPSGLYVTLHIANVPIAKWSAFISAQNGNIVVYGLLELEHQMTLMNVMLQRLPDLSGNLPEFPIKSKEKLIIQCGYRRFVVNPVFSQHTNGKKHKYERFFRPQSTVVASFFAPIQFPPAPVLAFKVNPDSTLALVASGRVLSCDPNRVVLKRIVLSGHPMRINRKSATIRYMFFNKEDVEYFKPVKLRTKCGRLGHIKESLGTHGHMKCYFDGQLRSYDTVYMYLYKRVFPKYNYEECLISSAEHQNELDNAKME